MTDMGITEAGHGVDAVVASGGSAVIDAATLTDIVDFVWQTFAGEPGPQRVGSPTAHEPADRFAAISIGGAWTATLLVATTDACAARFAGALLGLAPADVDPADLDDAFGELVNVVGGNVKGLVDDPGATLSLPVVAPSRPAVTGGQLTVRIAYDLGGQAMAWELWERP